jgi:hypothetical protein
MNHENCNSTLNLAEKLIEGCEKFELNNDLQRLKSNLSSSVDFCRNSEMAKPLIITLMGGTGTGKSYIFSRLYGEDSASPSSDSIRGFTKQPFVSACENDRPFLNFGNNANFLPGILEGAVLVDSPDLDSTNRENTALARKLIDASDILVYVTTPDKRSNFDINQTIVEWGSRKRWFFVMNKIDTAQDVESEKLRKDFSQRINALGFNVNPASLFLFSARKQDSFEFNRFKDLVFSKRSFQQSRTLRNLACLRSIRHGLGESGSILRKTLQKLNEHHEKILERLKSAQEKVLCESDLCHLADQARVREVFRHLSSRRLFFLFPYIIVANHINTGVSSSEVAAGISRALRHDPDFKSCEIDETRILTDLQLTNESEDNEAEIQTSPVAAMEIKTRLTSFAAKIAASKTLTLYSILANLLPAIILVQALYRAFASWITGVWLPSDFFVHAAILTAGATVPGYFLFSRGVTRLASTDDMREYRQTVKANQLYKVQKHIEYLISLETELQSRLKKEIGEREKQIDGANLGISRPE